MVVGMRYRGEMVTHGEAHRRNGAGVERWLPARHGRNLIIKYIAAPCANGVALGDTRYTPSYLL